MAAMPATRPLLLTILLYGVAVVATAAPADPNTEGPHAEDALPPVTGVPSDEALEAAGARIGAIEIRTVDIFDLNNPADDHWLFRLANHLHVETRESAIRSQLLFHAGDRYSRRLLAETARNLRTNSSFLREPVIRPIRYHDGVVDIEVVTHDVWTLQPGINFHRSGGSNSSSVDFSDANFLGFGKYVEIGHGRDVDRSSTYMNWSDPNVWGSHWTDTLMYSKNSDGTVWNVTGGLPFYSMATKFSVGANAGDDHSIVNRYRLGQQYDSYDNNRRVADLFAGQALKIDDNWSNRITYGWHYDFSHFAPPPAMAPPLAPLPQNRDLSYPFVRVDWLQNDFQTIQNLDLIARTEDVHYGLQAGVGLGWATPTLGSDRNSLIGDSEINYGWHFGSVHELFLTSRLYSRFEQGQLRDALASVSTAYFVATSDHTRAMVRFGADAGHDLDGDHFLTLGGDTGLRGYPLRYQNGNQRALLTVEERLYTNWYLFRLVNVGGAAFYDMGRTWGSTLVPTPQLGLLKDVGVGLRLGNARSSFGSVIHIDVAVPLERDSDINRVQFLVSTQQSF